MCGIVGAVANRNVSAILLEGLQRLEYRGYDSAGLAVVTNEPRGIDCRRTLGKVKELSERVIESPARGTTGIAHTRWATHGVPNENNAHPHVSNGRIALVHNGIIENYESLRDGLVDAGYEFNSDTDSEIIVHLIDQHYSQTSDLLRAVREAVNKLKGAYAIGVLCSDEPGRIVAVRVGSPLVVGVGIGENFIASDVLALRPVTDRFIFLEEGDLVDVGANSIAVWNVDDETVVRSTVRVEHAFDEVDKGNYRHHMQREIHEQPRVMRDTLEGRIGGTRVLERAFGVGVANVLDGTKNVTITACGTAFYAACIARNWIERIVGIPCEVEIASEWRYRSVVVPQQGSLFMTVSQSGETADTLAALRVAKKIGFEHTLTVCNVPMSSLVRESDMAIMLHAGPEIGVASTKAFTAMLADLLMLTILLGRRHGLAVEREEELVEALTSLEEVVRQTLGLDSRLRRLAEEFVERRHALFLGRGLQFPVALEGALKLKEISYIHAEGYPAGELKHGPLALVTDEMPVVAVAPNNDLLEKIQSNLQEVRARGGQLYVFADVEAGFKDEPGVTVIEVPKVHDDVAPIVYTVPLQLLAYHVAVLKGTDVDQPRNLAKSVTVE
jgi:glucosamine--fructose-6-phosphate aminotransferase (isomerizing)